MPEFDEDIDAAIAAEERALLRQIAYEPGYVRQLADIFRGRTAWVNMVMLLAHFLLFVGGVYAAWRFFQATDVLIALRWGLPASVMLLASLLIKLAFWPILQTNRVLLALARYDRGARADVSKEHRL